MPVSMGFPEKFTLRKLAIITAQILFWEDLLKEHINMESHHESGKNIKPQRLKHII